MPVGRKVKARFVQLLKALSPIDMMPVGREVWTRFLQSLKAALPIDLTESGILT